MRKTFFVTLVLALLSPGAATAKIVADCGAASGKAFYANPTSNQWQDDQTTDGRTLVDILPDGSATVIMRNAMQETSDVRDKGGKLIVLGRTPDWSEFTLAVVYPGGTIETYMLTDKGGFRALLSTVSRHSAGPVPPKVAAYLSRCE